MINWIGGGRSRSWPNLTYHPGICLAILRTTTKTLNHDNRCAGRDLNLGPPEYEGGMLTTQSRRLVDER
jgi:hypothetical protein